MIKAYLVTSLLSLSIFAQGYCSLRNPISKIKSFYPDCSGYKTIVKTIGNEARVLVDSILPFSIHHHEVGRHNLYFITEARTTKGLVHARTEQSPWGLVEIVWSLNTDLTVRDFAFQRCRTPLKSELIKEEFKKQIVGKHFYELRTLIDHNGEINTQFKIDKEAKALVKLVVHSALKTIALTDFCWKSELKKLRFQSMHNFIAKTDIQDLTNIKVSGNNIEAMYKGIPLKAVVQNSKVDKLYLPITKDLQGTNIRELKKKILEGSK